MIVMDFYVYDNMDMYMKKNPKSFTDDPLVNLEIKRVAITVQGAFWFETDMDNIEFNTNINRPYVHLHKKMHKFSKMQFEKEPSFIDLKNVVYNPKKKTIEIKKPGAMFWNKKLIFMKNVKGRYYGNKIPDNNMKCLGSWFHDHRTQSIHIILNFYPGLQTKDGKPARLN
jgi:hypothetical protein